LSIRLKKYLPLRIRHAVWGTALLSGIWIGIPAAGFTASSLMEAITMRQYETSPERSGVFPEIEVLYSDDKGRELRQDVQAILRNSPKHETVFT
jgi:hypothetical protein